MSQSLIISRLTHPTLSTTLASAPAVSNCGSWLIGSRQRAESPSCASSGRRMRIIILNTSLDCSRPRLKLRSGRRTWLSARTKARERQRLRRATKNYMRDGRLNVRLTNRRDATMPPKMRSTAMPMKRPYWPTISVSKLTENETHEPNGK